MSDDTVFTYPFTIPETTVELKISKEQIVNLIEDIVERPLTQKEADLAWRKIKHKYAWYDIFPSWAALHGVHMYGSCDRQFFHECFEPHLQSFADETMKSLLDPLFRYPLEDYIHEGFLKTEDSDAETTELTLENIEQQTKTRIQDENVKNGLARCARESKQKSIQKWKNWYLSNQKK